MDYEGHSIQLHNASLVLAKAKRGYVMCGYLNMETAEKLGDAACVVTGVSDVRGLLKAEIRSCTRKAKDLGVSEGMTGEQALRLMN